MPNTFKSSWTPRTGIHSQSSATPGSHEDWVRTRDIILKVVRRFPEVIGAVRDALNAASRPFPEELRVPGP